MTHSAQDHINSARATAIKIHKDSRLIHKSSSNNSSSSNSSTISTATTTQPPRRQPVIIYTHSPEVIHTTPSDFMALVQKLTGKPQSPENTNDGCSAANAPSPLLPPPPANVTRKNKRAKIISAPCDDSSSTSENRGFGRDGNLNCSSLSSCSVMSSVGFDAPLPPPPPNSFFADVPLFSHGSQDLYCFPIRCTDSSACFPSIPGENCGSLSPSVIEALKAYHKR